MLSCNFPPPSSNLLLPDTPFLLSIPANLIGALLLQGVPAGEEERREKGGGGQSFSTGSLPANWVLIVWAEGERGSWGYAGPCSGSGGEGR